MAIFGSWPLIWNVAAFCVCAALIGVLGSRLSGFADRLADRAKLGEALMGGLFLGAVTSISGSVLSITAALNGHADLALSNAFGGLAAQTVFLAVVDILYRRANLEHAAASAGNMVQGALLVCTLSIVLLATYSPEWTLLGVHPGTVLLIAGYAYGMWLVRRSKLEPMWRPTRTKETRTDEPDKENQSLDLKWLWGGFIGLGLALAVCGWGLQLVASAIVSQTGMPPAVMGALFTSVATSLPELVTTIAAVKRGALTLAVSGIIGGNAYDTLFAAFSDIAYREGSIYHTMDAGLLFWVAVNLLMSGVLILGMLLRERHGIGNIGFESFLILVFYALAVFVLLTGTG